MPKFRRDRHGRSYRESRSRSRSRGRHWEERRDQERSSTASSFSPGYESHSSRSWSSNKRSHQSSSSYAGGDRDRGEISSPSSSRAASSPGRRSTSMYRETSREVNKNSERVNMNNNTETENHLKIFLRSSLAGLDLRSEDVYLEVEKIVRSLREVVDRIDGGSLGVDQLTNLLILAGYKTGAGLTSCQRAHF